MQLTIVSWICSTLHTFPNRVYFYCLIESWNWKLSDFEPRYRRVVQLALSIWPRSGFPTSAWHCSLLRSSPTFSCPPSNSDGIWILRAEGCAVRGFEAPRVIQMYCQFERNTNWDDEFILSSRWQGCIQIAVSQQESEAWAVIWRVSFSIRVES